MAQGIEIGIGTIYDGSGVVDAERANAHLIETLNRSADAVDKQALKSKNAEEVAKMLAREQERLASITDKSSEEYARASRNVEILKHAMAELSKGAKSSATSMNLFAKSAAAVRNFAGGIFRNLANIKAGFDMAFAAARKFLDLMSRGMEFEAMTARFKSLTGSMELARAHMKDLQDLGRTPPFSLEQFAAASQQMMKMTGGMAGFRKEMEMVGDMAAATGNSIEAVGRAFGLAYQVVRDGQSFGRAGQMLYTMGVLTKQQVAYFDELSKSGAKNTEVWEELVKVFDRYKGAMAETEKTTKGVVDAIKGEAEVALMDFSAAITEAAEPAIKGLLGWLRRINEDGTIEEWAEKVGSALSFVIEKMNVAIETSKTLADAIGWVGERIGVTDLWHSIQAGASAVGATAGALYAGDSLGGAWDSAKRYYADEASKGFYGRKLMKSGFFGEDEKDKTIQDERDEARAVEEERQRVQDRLERKKARREKDRAKVAEEAERRMAEDMAKAQIEIDKRVAAEKAKADSEAAEKAEKERLKAVEAERRAREKMEADLHRQRVANARAELKAATDNQSAMQSAASHAQTEFEKAFGMYRDRDLAARTIAEERDYAADYKRLGRDASRYGGKWRIDELASLMAAGDVQGQAARLEEWRKSSRFTPEVEAMVRASAADQTRTTAEAELRKIAANTEGLARKLDELLEVK